MEGIPLVADEQGEKVAVMIDLRKYGDLWEGFYDAITAQSHQDEPRETLESVKTRLVQRGKLDG